MPRFTSPFRDRPEAIGTFPSVPFTGIKGHRYGKGQTLPGASIKGDFPERHSHYEPTLKNVPSFEKERRDSSSKRKKSTPRFQSAPRTSTYMETWIPNVGDDDSVLGLVRRRSKSTSNNNGSIRENLEGSSVSDSYRKLRRMSSLSVQSLSSSISSSPSTPNQRRSFAKRNSFSGLNGDDDDVSVLSSSAYSFRSSRRPSLSPNQSFNSNIQLSSNLSLVSRSNSSLSSSMSVYSTKKKKKFENLLNSVIGRFDEEVATLSQMEASNVFFPTINPSDKVITAVRNHFMAVASKWIAASQVLLNETNHIKNQIELSQAEIESNETLIDSNKRLIDAIDVAQRLNSLNTRYDSDNDEMDIKNEDFVAPDDPHFWDMPPTSKDAPIHSLKSIPLSEVANSVAQPSMSLSRSSSHSLLGSISAAHPSPSSLSIPTTFGSSVAPVFSSNFSSVATSPSLSYSFSSPALSSDGGDQPSLEEIRTALRCKAAAVQANRIWRNQILKKSMNNHVGDINGDEHYSPLSLSNPSPQVVSSPSSKSSLILMSPSSSNQPQPESPMSTFAHRAGLYMSSPVQSPKSSVLKKENGPDNNNSGRSLSDRKIESRLFYVADSPKSINNEISKESSPSIPRPPPLTRSASFQNARDTRSSLMSLTSPTSLKSPTITTGLKRVGEVPPSPSAESLAAHPKFWSNFEKSLDCFQKEDSYHGHLQILQTHHQSLEPEPAATSK